ncbi:MAG: hypothetical protein E7374_00675 [Clostridiales bacterium]|nr:hypothetical protein [Clostridiales bacterium]
MAKRKTASKTSKKVELDFNFNKPKKSESKKVNKKLKKLGFGTVCLILFVLAVGVAGGFFGVKFLTRNDCFEIVGNDELTLTLDKTYEDTGVKIVAFGKDESDKVEIETNLEKHEDGTYSADSEGTYYIQYTATNLKYGKIFKIKKIRLITFVEPTEQEEIFNAGGNNE